MSTKEEETTTPVEQGIRIGDRVYDSPDDFTLGEAEVIKENTGLSPQDLIVGVQDDPTDPQYLRAIGWVVLHRQSSKTEWDDKRLTETSIGMFFAVPDDEEADAAPPASRRKRSSSAKPTT